MREFSDGDARLWTHQLAACRRRIRSESVSPPGRSGWSDRAPRRSPPASAIPDLQAVVFDLPEAGPLAREIISDSTVADRIEIVSGDFFVDPLPEGDLFSLGRILHDWTEPKVLTLLQRIFDRLPSGGALLDRRKADFRRPDRATMGSHAEPGNATLHRRERANALRVSRVFSSESVFRP